MIDVRNVTKYYGDFRAVNNVSFSIAKGEIVGLLGPNGAGKTTTMRMITGYLSPTEGEILIDKKSISSDSCQARARIGYLPESAPLYNDMIVFDYLQYAARVRAVTDSSKVLNTAETCGLFDVMHKKIGELSRGYRQRVGLAYAMLHDPEILVLDEPTSGLDPNQIIDVRALIKKAGREKTVIISTHILPEVEMLCDRIIIVSDGEVVADAGTEELHARLGHTACVKMTVAGADEAGIHKLVSGVPGTSEITILDTAHGRSTLLVGFSEGSEIRPALCSAIQGAGLDLYELTMQKNTLEDVFRNLTLGGVQ